MGSFGGGRGEVVPPAALAVPQSTTEVHVVHHRAERFYELLEDGEPVGMLIYENGSGHVRISHTMIRADRRGLGFGTTLISTVLGDLRAAGSPVKVSCPTVIGFLERFPQYADLHGLGGPSPVPVGDGTTPGLEALL